MFDRIKTRLASEEGFTLIELLVVIIILGILVAIAVPAYLSFTGTAKDAAAKSNIRSAIPAAESYYQNNGDSYTGLTSGATGTLEGQAPGVSSDVKVAVLNGGDGYCLEDAKGNNQSWDYIGGTPGTVTGAVGTIQPGTCQAEAGTAAG
jgi:type IV pilus assembly protein PilA